MSSARPNYVTQTVPVWRRWAVLGLLGLGVVVVFGRAFQLQVLQRDFLVQEGDKRHIRTLVIPGHRGAIRDRRGEPLALSAPVEMIWAVPAALLESPQHVYAVAKLLGRNPKDLQDFLRNRKDRKFVYISDAISPAEAERVLSLKAPGVFSEAAYARYYPAGEVAGQVVGFCGRDGRGQEGLELAQEAALAGKAGARRVIRDRTGRVVEDNLESKDALSGKDLALTIDLRIQYLAYRELKAAVARNNARGGLVVVADSTTGEILAMASQPGFNPNNVEDRKGGGSRNRGITDGFEPGSTVKPLLVAQALELGVYQPTSHIDTTPGFFKVGALTVRDEHPQGDVDLKVLLSKSSNVGAAKIGLALGAESVWSGYQRFGFGEPIYSGFPGEASPVLRHYSEWGQIATATASYGYGLSLTAMHLVRAYAALANDGLMPQLRLLASAPQVPPQRAVSAVVASEMRELMEGVVQEGGTAQRAAIPGYRVAGKTGTIRKVADSGGYADKRHQSVFIGMLPAEHPRLVGLVMIDEPGAGDYYGGLVAAPVFSTVMQGAARLLRIPPGQMNLPTSPIAAPIPTRQTVALPIREPRT
ncbi:peptidoglycan D,D-transpeptidase FtsI family protein [Stenotrophobium rhamnosiphilum]|uniref:Peptidoglycan D,D-transpeptidase FtsI n=1 Tax=Stenotrophobium rhamnosiphilum TaxID=2029166 RepID=A0A2T5MDP0_9GAMM|nr:penicillin-binding protein 2 [Stenotrophobium rhamnosiphilum]PTU30698.1 cell division protein [Stenotrophobium rhamnosiphilum]